MTTTQFQDLARDRDRERTVQVLRTSRVRVLREARPRRRLSRRAA